MPTRSQLGLEEGPHTFHVINNKLAHPLASAHRTFLRLIVRRIRPGLHFTENSIWIAITMILYCFEIKTTRSENDVDIDIEPPVDSDGFSGSVQKKIQLIHGLVQMF